VREANLAAEEPQKSKCTPKTALSWLEVGRARSETLDTWEDGTCEWLFHHEAWQAWDEAGFVPILWIYGIPGK
jgi:hypothetical protein